MLKQSIASILAVCALNAHAEWEYEVTPYLWAVAQNGETGNSTSQAEFDASFSDILSNLDMALLLAFNAEQERWGVKLDSIYMDISADAKVLNSKIDVDVQQTLLSAGLFYKPQQIEGLKLHAGARYVDLDNGFDFKGGIVPVNFSKNLGDSWTEAYIGAQYSIVFNPQLSLNLYGDVGGFSGQSDSMYQAAVILDYAINDRFSVKGGYRILDMDYDTTDFVFDAKTDGIALGLGIRF